MKGVKRPQRGRRRSVPPCPSFQAAEIEAKECIAGQPRREDRESSIGGEKPNAMGRSSYIKESPDDDGESIGGVVQCQVDVRRQVDVFC